MEKFTAENIMHLLMIAGQRAIKKNIDSMAKTGLPKEKASEVAFVMMSDYGELTKEMHELVKCPRGFEVARGFEEKGVKLPERGTLLSAGYDIRALDDVKIEPKQTARIATGVKAFMQGDEVLMLYPRSSMGIKKHCNLANGVAVIDADYYNNKDNDGHIIVCLYNFGDSPVEIMAGDRIAQGVFHKYKTMGDIPSTFRTGGTGSTGK